MSLRKKHGQTTTRQQTAKLILFARRKVHTLRSQDLLLGGCGAVVPHHSCVSTNIDWNHVRANLVPRRGVVAHVDTRKGADRLPEMPPEPERPCCRVQSRSLAVGQVVPDAGRPGRLRIAG